MTDANIDFIAAMMEKASHEYHNNGAYLKLSDADMLNLKTIVPDMPMHLSTLEAVTDPLFDFLEDYLTGVDPTNSVLKKVGAQIVKEKAKLPFQMSGLEKITVGTVESFASKSTGPYNVSDKLDGISIQLQYSGNKISAFTRGDGIFGEDISYLIPYLRLPKKCSYTNIRGEIIMKESTFNKKWASEYENARNLVAGKVNAHSIHLSLYDMDVVIYGVLSDSSEVPSEQLANLKDQGFNVVQYQTLEAVNDEILSSTLRARKLKSEYALDGIVVVENRTGLKHSVDSPDWGRKFKENLEEYEVTVTGWDTEPSKDGYIKGRLLITPTRMGGVTVSQATFFNYKFVVENKIGIGTKLLVTRSGDVIPHILEVIEPSEKILEPTEPWVWNATGVDAVVADPDSHPTVLLKRIWFFFHTLKIDELGESTFEKAIDAGFNTVEKIIKMTQKDWKSIDGFAGRKGEICFTELQKCMLNVYLPALADASGFFGRGFGTSRFEFILNEYPDLLSRSIVSAEQAFELARNVKGFGETLARQFANGIIPFKKWMSDLDGHVAFKEPEKTAVVGAVFANQGVTFTGFRNEEWQIIVEQQGGNYVDFGGKTTMLVYGGKKSSKVDKAIAKGIKVFSQGEFLQFLEQHKLG